MSKPRSLAVIDENDRPEEVMHRLIAGLKQRDGCSDTCHIYHSCPYQWLSSTAKPDKFGHHPCFLRAQPQITIRRVVNLFLTGEKGLLDEMARAIFEYSKQVNVNQTPRAWKEFLGMLVAYHKCAYGGLQDRLPPGSLNIQINTKVVGDKGKGLKSMPAGTPVIVDAEAVQVEDLEDPQSLIHTENEEIFKLAGRRKDGSERQ